MFLDCEEFTKLYTLRPCADPYYSYSPKSTLVELILLTHFTRGSLEFCWGSTLVCDRTGVTCRILTIHRTYRVKLLLRLQPNTTHTHTHTQVYYAR
ncbi:hypothetical protein HZ326_22502 [Fusarium oxysporum f. sp. albedinis]|nr:hypothetical protein HZ326_22502 [Fusarium oxysporum f. sp. albedinis]